MRERSKSTSYSVDIVLITAMGNELAILLTRNTGDRERWALPWRFTQAGEALENAATRVAQEALGESPSWMEQVGAFGDGKRHPSDAEVSVAYVGLVPHENASPRTGFTWFQLAELPALAPRQRAMVDGATKTIQGRLDQAP